MSQHSYQFTISQCWVRNTSHLYLSSGFDKVPLGFCRNWWIFPISSWKNHPLTKLCKFKGHCYYRVLRSRSSWQLSNKPDLRSWTYLVRTLRTSLTPVLFMRSRSGVLGWSLHRDTLIWTGACSLQRWIQLYVCWVPRSLTHIQVIFIVLVGQVGDLYSTSVLHSTNWCSWRGKIRTIL